MKFPSQHHSGWIWIMYYFDPCIMATLCYRRDSQTIHAARRVATFGALSRPILCSYVRHRFKIFSVSGHHISPVPSNANDIFKSLSVGCAFSLPPRPEFAFVGLRKCCSFADLQPSSCIGLLSPYWCLHCNRECALLCSSKQVLFSLLLSTSVSP